jgi:energy-coupling factor transporter ATP-binding protein EcfA2
MDNSKRHETIILIGPEGAGKSTVGKLIAQALSRELYSLDRNRDVLYAPYHYDKIHAERIYEEQGLWQFYQHWKFFEYRAVVHILTTAGNPNSDFHGKVLDFGAGHSVYENPAELEKVHELMKPYPDVFLFLPCEDVGEALKVTETRRGHALGLNKHFLEHPSNRKLAKHVIYTKDRTAEECAEDVLKLVMENGANR